MFMVQWLMQGRGSWEHAAAREGIHNHLGIRKGSSVGLHRLIGLFELLLIRFNVALLELSGISVAVGSVGDDENVVGCESLFFPFGIANSFLLASRSSAVFFFELTY